MTQKQTSQGKLTDRVRGLLNKCRGAKGQTVLVAALGLAGVLLLVWPTAAQQPDAVPTPEAAQPPNVDYAQQLAAQLEETLGKMEGVGQIKVMVTLEQQEEYVYAADLVTEERTQQEEKLRQQEQTHVILEQDGSQQALVTTTMAPRVQGVVVVCTGGDDPVVQRSLTQAVTAVLNIGSNRIAVSKFAATE